MSIQVVLAKWPGYLAPGGFLALGGSGSDMEKGLVSHLENDAGVAAIVGSRIYPEPAPQNASYPLIVYTRITGTHEHDLQGAAGLCEARYQLRCWAESRSAVKALAEAVRLALQGFSGSMGDVDVRGIFLESDDDEYIPASTDAHERYAVRQDFLCVYRESVPS